MIAFTSVTAWAQTSKIDSLLNQLESTQLDTSRVWLLNDLSYAYYQFSADSTLKYARLALALSESLHYPMGLVKSYGNLGVGHAVLSELDSAIHYSYEALEIAEHQGMLRQQAASLNNIGHMNFSRGEYVKALEAYDRSLKLLSNEAHKDLLANCYQGLGTSYKAVKNIIGALEYFDKAKELLVELGNENDLVFTLNNIASIYLSAEDALTAEKYLMQAYNLCRKFNNQYGLATIMLNLTNVNRNMGRFDRARAYYRQGLAVASKIHDRIRIASFKLRYADLLVDEMKYDSADRLFAEAYDIGDKHGINYVKMESCYGRANIRQLQGLHREAIAFAKAGFDIAEMLKNADEILLGSRMLSAAYAELGDFSNAAFYFKTNAEKLDLLYSNLVTSELALFNSNEENERIVAENEELAETNEMILISIDRKNAIISMIGLLAVLAFASSLVLFKYYKTKKRVVTLLKLKNLEISEQSRQLKAANQEIQEINASLESTVKIRTEEIQQQNEKLRNYAFSNSHLVRAPLARILGIVDVLRNNQTDQKEARQFLESLEVSAQELDAVIKDVNEILN